MKEFGFRTKEGGRVHCTSTTSVKHSVIVMIVIIVVVSDKSALQCPSFRDEEYCSTGDGKLQRAAKSDPTGCDKLFTGTQPPHCVSQSISYPLSQGIWSGIGT